MVLVGLIAIAIMIGSSFFRAQAWRSTMRQIADRYDLDLSVGGMFQRSSARGRIEGIPICVDTYSEQSGKSRQVYTRVVATPTLPPGLVLRREGFKLFGTLFKGEDLQVGDPDFDARALVRGPTRALRALLDVETRKTVLDGFSHKIDTQDDEIKWTDSGLSDFDELVGIIELSLEIGRKLSRPADDAALAHVVRTDDPAVAIEALQVMPVGAARDAIDAEVLTTRADALALAAARRVGKTAAPAVERVLANGRNSDAVRAEALTWLGRHIDAIEIARAHLTRPVIAAAALPILMNAEPPVPLDALTRLAGHTEVAAAALRAARRHGTAAESMLIDALGSEDAIARVAADGLGLVGTTAAVMPLREKTKGLFADGQLKSAALAAIEMIQGRVGAVGGGLSVVEASAAGQLSEVRAARRLSETE